MKGNDKMHLIFEACDAGGKTTTIEKLQEKLGWKVIKGSSFELAKLDSLGLIKAFHDMTLDNYKENVIFDRFIYSNEVYAKMFNDYTLLSDDVRRALEEDFPEQTYIIYLYANPEIIKQRLLERGDDYISTDHVEKIMDGYSDAIDKTNIRVLFYNTGQRSADDIVDSIIRIIEEESE